MYNYLISVNSCQVLFTFSFVNHISELRGILDRPRLSLIISVSYTLQLVKLFFIAYVPYNLKTS